MRLAGRGYRLALLGRRASRLDETFNALAGAGHSVHPVDLTDSGSVGLLVEDIVDHHRSVDALVHCAGGIRADGGDDLAAFEVELLETYRSNVVTAALLTEAVLPHMSVDRGRIVVTSSIAALRGGGVAYAAAKSALHGWAYTMAARVGARGITVNAVAPGYITETDFFGEGMTPERHERLIAQTMVGRAGVPDDVAATIEHLVSADARHITAQVVQVNGGALPR